MDVLAILNKKSRPVYTVAIDQSVDDAINLMAAKNVDALIVTDAKRPAGIFSKRDVFQYYLLSGKETGSNVKVKRLITHRMVSAESRDDIEDIIAMMINADMDHLPVVENDKILGLLAFKDLVEFRLEALAGEIHQLNAYIDDLHEAGQD